MDSSDSQVSRRALFQIAGTAAAAGQTPDAHPPAPAAPAGKAPYQRKTFDEHQWRTVHVLCDLIIPADERSGSASQAGVPEFIDDWLDFRKREELNDTPVAQIQGLLAWLDQESNRLSGKDFAGAPAATQKQKPYPPGWGPARRPRARP